MHVCMNFQSFSYLLLQASSFFLLPSLPPLVLRRTILEREVRHLRYTSGMDASSLQKGREGRRKENGKDLLKYNMTLRQSLRPLPSSLPFSLPTSHSRVCCG